jgi:hypothetical protein
MNGKIEIKIADIIGGFATNGFIVSILISMIAFSLPEQFQFTLWLIAIMFINVSTGLFIRLGQKFEWPSCIASIGSLWGVIFATDLIAIFYFFLADKRRLCWYVFYFSILAFVLMLRIGHCSWQKFKFYCD